MIAQIAYVRLLGLPVVAYLGMLTLLSLLFTALVGYLNFTGRAIIPFRWHPRLAVTTILLALIHALFALSAYFRF